MIHIYLGWIVLCGERNEDWMYYIPMWWMLRIQMSFN